MSMQPAPLPVTYLLRHPVPGWHSIETVFATVAAHLPGDVVATTEVSPRPSTGFAARLVNLLAAVRLRRRPGVLHITGDVHYLALVLPRRRTVLTVHDLGTLAVGGRSHRALIALLWFHLPVRWVAHVTTISDATRDALVALIPGCADKVTVIPNPLPAGLQQRPDRPVHERPVVLAIGTTPNKNLHRLAQAIAPLSVHLVVVGAVPDDVRAVLDAEDRCATSESHVDLTREALAALYAQADLLAFVSTSEGFGVPVIEAQSIGLPVLTSRIPPLVEVAGDGALLVDPLDVAAIRAGVGRLVVDRDLRETLVRAGRANVARFDPDVVAARYAEVARAVAGSGRGRGRTGSVPRGRPWVRARA